MESTAEPSMAHRPVTMMVDNEGPPRNSKSVRQAAEIRSMSPRQPRFMTPTNSLLLESREIDITYRVQNPRV
nr:hypothetical protein CFP56_21905 [Quercus suber]